jgi:hypothetical protein
MSGEMRDLERVKKLMHALEDQMHSFSGRPRRVAGALDRERHREGCRSPCANAPRSSPAAHHAAAALVLALADTLQMPEGFGRFRHTP